MESSGISTKQKRAIAALLTGANCTEAAQTAKVHENTVYQWMHDPAFLAALHQAEADALQAVSRELVALAGKAAQTLDGVLDDPQARDSSKVRAADVVLGRILQMKELVDLEQRINALEAAQNEQRA